MARRARPSWERSTAQDFGRFLIGPALINPPRCRDGCTHPRAPSRSSRALGGGRAADPPDVETGSRTTGFDAPTGRGRCRSRRPRHHRAPISATFVERISLKARRGHDGAVLLVGQRSPWSGCHEQALPVRDRLARRPSAPDFATAGQEHEDVPFVAVAQELLARRCATCDVRAARASGEGGRWRGGRRGPLQRRTGQSPR